MISKVFRNKMLLIKNLRGGHASFTVPDHPPVKLYNYRRIVFLKAHKPSHEHVVSF